MAITDVPEFAHLTDTDIENLAEELDAIRRDIEDSRGARDARYIRRTIAAQRGLEVVGRLLLTRSSRRGFFWAGAGTLGARIFFRDRKHKWAGMNFQRMNTAFTGRIAGRAG